MVMEIVNEEGYDKNDVIKPMSDMTGGEVCYLEDVGYILRIGDGDNALFLILEGGDDDECDYYSKVPSLSLKVREIHEDESITIKFS